MMITENFHHFGLAPYFRQFLHNLLGLRMVTIFDSLSIRRNRGQDRWNLGELTESLG